MLETLRFDAVRSRFRRLKAAFRGWIDAALQGTHDHYSCFLPARPGRFSQFLFKLFFSGIIVGKEEVEKLKNLPPDGIVVYATKYKSRFEYLFYHTRFRIEGIRVPEIGLDYRIIWFQPIGRIFRMFLANVDHLYRHWRFPDPYGSGYVRRALLEDRAALLSLVEKRGFQRRFVQTNTDPLRYLIEMQKTEGRPIYIVPQLMFFGRNPHRSIPTLTQILFGSEQKPGTIRRFATLFSNPGKIFVEVSEPFNLKAFLESPMVRGQGTENQSFALRRQLLVQINRHRQSITGPVLKTREELKENILTNHRLRNFMESYSETRNIPRYKVHREAEGYLDEIAAKYSLAMIQIFSSLVKWLINTMFEGFTVNTETLNRVKSESRKGPLILVPCHKSHIDYLILSYVLYHHNMPVPHVAAGKNLSFWPLGPLFRGGGAFFIRRTFRGAVLYSKVFAEYVFKLMEEGFNIEFFIEGGRSRTGKLIQPKFGLLSILINAFREGACDDLIFAPVYIGYDRVPEEGAYLHELEGGQKNPESLLQVIKARKFLKRRYGKIYLQFHEPISLNRLLSRRETPLSKMTSKEQNALTRYLGYRLINAIDRVTVVTPHAVVAAALLNCAKQRFTFDQIMEDIETYMNHLYALKARLADTLLIDYIHGVRYVFDTYAHHKFIERIGPDKNGQSREEYFSVNPVKRPVLDYYKNNGINYFIPAAFTSMAILERDAFQFSTSELFNSYAFLREFFNNEFAYDVDAGPEQFIRENLRLFIDDAILMPHPELSETYNITSAGYRKIKLFAGFLKTYFESYWIVLNVLTRYPRSFLDTKNRFKKIEAMGSRMFKRKEIERQESLSRMNYKNAVDFFTTQGVRGSEDTEKIEYYSETIQRYLNRLFV